MENEVNIQMQRTLASNDPDSSFYKRCISLFQYLNPKGGSSFEEDVWVIPFSNEHYNTSNVVLDFTIFDLTELEIVPSVKAMWNNGLEIHISQGLFVKWLFLELVSERSVDYRLMWLLDTMKSLFLFIKEQNTHVLTEYHVEDFYSVLLTHDFEDTRFVRRLSTPSYKSRIYHLNFVTIYLLLARYQINFLVGKISVDAQNHALNEACLNQTGMTLTDYKAGGTFDFLGLDIGRHYVDYCAEFFDAHIAFATAARKTVSAMEIFIENFGDKSQTSGSRLMQIVITALQGETYFSNYESNRDREQLVRDETLKMFHLIYNKCVVQTKAFSLDFLNAVAADLGLMEHRLDTYEFIRSMMYTRFLASGVKSRERICVEYSSVVVGGDFTGNSTRFELHQVDEVCDKHLNGLTIEICDVSKFCKQTIESYVNSSNRQQKKLDGMISDVEAAGVTAFAAYTGWRASEFGFPQSAISVELNKDIVDASYTPMRFYVNWTSSKTSGGTLLQREITLSTAIISNQLAELNAAELNDPALISGNFINLRDLTGKIAKRVTRLWVRFPYDYAIFKELDEHESLSVRFDDLALDEAMKLRLLSEKYDTGNDIVIEVLALREQLRSDAVRLEISQKAYTGENGSTVRFAETLRRYSQHKLDPSFTHSLNTYLSEDTKKYLFSSDKTADFLRQEAVNAIREEFTSGTIKATPHAFRHIWAEAILQRYRGDVGRFIRANFKHIDERFFMVYLRNKEVKSIYEVAKRTTINSVVRKHVSSLREGKRAYAGGFDRFVSKAVNLTKVVTHEDYAVIARKIAKERIVDIKVNAWSTCLLRAGTETHARCSIDGIPQRQNASPKLCLGCVNAEINDSNYVGIVIYTKSDVEACKNTNLPISIKKFHVATLRKALARVRELATNEKSSSYDSFIEHLEGVISMVDMEGLANG
ncbi:hypothetical protein [Shewanella sp.]|uniref:hypothetical protein n=1 Tax=Shewanella sp. TaxID=50422 RepID=UPI004053B47D